jgi:hypothetical protein
LNHSPDLPRAVNGVFCGFLHPEPAASRERVSPNLPRAVSGRDGSDIRETRRRNLPRAVIRGQASQPIQREAKPTPPPSHKIFYGTGASYGSMGEVGWRRSRCHLLRAFSRVFSHPLRVRYIWLGRTASARRWSPYTHRRRG